MTDKTAAISGPEGAELTWTDAPRLVEWGAGMMVADIQLDRDSTATIYAHSDDLGKVRAALGAAPEGGQPVATDAIDALAAVHKLVTEAAMTGFNPQDGDWADRLYRSQGDRWDILKRHSANRAKPAVPSPAPAPEPDKWRKLAQQFDGHRMAAMAHLRTLLDNPQAHADAARQFLAATPSEQIASVAPAHDETAWLLETSGGGHALYWDGGLWIGESPRISGVMQFGLTTTKDASKAVRFVSQELAEAALKSFRADYRVAIGGAGVWKTAEHMWPAVQALAVADEPSAKRLAQLLGRVMLEDHAEQFMGNNWHDAAREAMRAYNAAKPPVQNKEGT